MQFRFHLLALIMPLVAISCSTPGPPVGAGEEEQVYRIIGDERERLEQEIELQKHRAQIEIGRIGLLKWRENSKNKLNEVAQKISIKAGEKQLPVNFVTASELKAEGIPEDMVNAWTNGKAVYVTEGMVKFLKNEDEMAILVGHELAHAYKGHILQKLLKSAVITGAGVATEVASPGSGFGTFALLSGATIVFDRNQEREADFFGIVYANSAGFDVDVAPHFWKKFSIVIGDTNAIPFATTHPASAERMIRAQKLVDSLKGREMQPLGPVF